MQSEPQKPGRSLEEWYRLVTECRQSGLSDAEWCLRNGISRNSFYKAIGRLRKKAFNVPAPHDRKTLDLTAPHGKQDVVQIGIMPERHAPEHAAAIDVPVNFRAPITISLNGMEIMITNDADPFLAARLMQALRGMPC